MGGLEGIRPPRYLLFRLVWLVKPATPGEKRIFGGGKPPSNPHRVSPVILILYTICGLLYMLLAVGFHPLNLLQYVTFRTNGEP
jgi:hypothetical protein